MYKSCTNSEVFQRYAVLAQLVLAVGIAVLKKKKVFITKTEITQSL